MDPINAIKILKKWRWTYLGVTMLAIALIAVAPTGGAGGGSVVGGTVISSFQSSAKILLTPPRGNVSAFGGRTLVGMEQTQSWFADPTVLQELIRSEELLKRVTEQIKGGDTGWETLRGSVQVEPVSQGRYGVMLFNLSAVSTDPKEAQKVVRLLTEEFSSYVQEISAREFAATRKFVEELVVEAEQRRMQAEENLMLVREKYLNTPSDTEIASQQMTLQSQRRELAQKIPSLEAEVSSISAYLDGKVSTPPWTIVEKADVSLSSLESRLAEARLELEKAREVYTEENSNVVSAKERVARAEALYRDGLNDYAKSLLDAKNLELTQIRSQESSAAHQLNTLLATQMTPDDRRLTQKFERELSVWDENHLALTQQLYQARVVEQSSRRQGSVTVLQQPLAGIPVIEKNGNLVEDKEFANRTRNKYKKLAMAFPFCMVLGVAAALLREYLKTSMKLRPRVEEMLEVPVIAVIPPVPADLSIDWERFKRPGVAPVAELVLAGKHKPNGNGNGKNGHGNGNGTHGNGHSKPMSDGLDSKKMEAENFRRPE